MKITARTSFAQVETASRQQLENEIARCVAQTEAAQELLETATNQGHDNSFWTRAVSFADAEEAAARRALANWKNNDREKARRAFIFRRALSFKTEIHFNRLNQS